jgi:hypothetical protein
MRFSVIFNPTEFNIVVATAVYTPCFSWKVNNKKFFPHRDYPHYRFGDFEFLLQSLFEDDYKKSKPSNILVLVHESGHGSSEDLNLFKIELTQLGIAFEELIM